MARSWIVAVAATACFALPGCVGNDQGNLVTGLVKVAGGTMSTLTPTEISLLVDRVGEINPSLAITVDQAQAAAAADFLEQNHLNTVADIQNLINNPGNVVIPDSIISLVKSGDIPEIPQAVQNKF